MRYQAILGVLRVDAGGSPAASHFLCFAKESNQRKATRGSSSPQKRGDALRYSKRQAAAELGLEWAKAQEIAFVLALRQSSRTTPVVSALLGDSHREPSLMRSLCPITVVPAQAGTQFDVA